MTSQFGKPLVSETEKREVPCPKCGARPGRSCISHRISHGVRNERAMEQAHPERRQAWLESRGETRA